MDPPRLEDPNLFGESRSKLDLEKKQQTYKIPYYVLHGKEWNTFAFKHENNNSKNNKKSQKDIITSPGYLLKNINSWALVQTYWFSGVETKNLCF